MVWGVDLCRWLENFKRLSLVEYIIVLQNIINKSPAILSEAFLFFKLKLLASATT